MRHAGAGGLHALDALTDYPRTPCWSRRQRQAQRRHLRGADRRPSLAGLDTLQTDIRNHHVEAIAPWYY
jgi:hypothetical protein